jgi:hypothetical protein
MFSSIHERFGAGADFWWLILCGLAPCIWRSSPAELLSQGRQTTMNINRIASSGRISKQI